MSFDMKHKFAALVLAIKDDFCLEEGIQSLYAQGVEEVLIISPAAYWTDDKEQPQAEFEQLLNIARRTNSILLPAYRKSDHEKAGPLYTEGMYRNHGRDILRMSFPEIEYYITMDADEFWLPGTLEEVDSLVEPGYTVTLPGIPVIAGLPVQGAADGILVATHRDVEFTWCRVTEGPRRHGTKPVIHFSCTRRTLEEVAEKCRKSAHYVDPVYDFEGWIKNVLPNVHVGMKNAHMYKSEVNIWPEVRAWTEAELAALPASLKPYLR